MASGFRPANVNDLASCFEMYALAHRHAYDDDVWHALPELWRKLLKARALIMSAWEDESRPPGQRLLGFGSAVFLRDEFARTLLDDPAPYIANRIYRAMLQGASLILDADEVRKMNSGPGVHVFLPHMAFHTSDWGSPELMALSHLAHRAFHADISGYRLQTLFQEGFGEMHRQVAENAGWLTRSCQGNGPAPEGAAALRPFVASMSKAHALSHPGALDSILFVYPPPLFFFSVAEQDLLALALRDFSDAEISAELSLSLNTLKKRWRDVYHRATGVRADFFPSDVAAAESNKRGAEKRRYLLGYLRQHPEELRPFARPATRQSTTKA